MNFRMIDNEAAICEAVDLDTGEFFARKEGEEHSKGTFMVITSCVDVFKTNWEKQTNFNLPNMDGRNGSVQEDIVIALDIIEKRICYFPSEISVVKLVQTKELELMLATDQ